MVESVKLILLNCAQMLCQEHLLKVSIRNSHVNIMLHFSDIWQGHSHYVLRAIKNPCKKHILEFNTPGKT